MEERSEERPELRNTVGVVAILSSGGNLFKASHSHWKMWTRVWGNAESSLSETCDCYCGEFKMRICSHYGSENAAVEIALLHLHLSSTWSCIYHGSLSWKNNSRLHYTTSIENCFNLKLSSIIYLCNAHIIKRRTKHIRCYENAFFSRRFNSKPQSRRERNVCVPIKQKGDKLRYIFTFKFF